MVVCLELKEGKYSDDDYARITHELSSAISADNGLLPAVITVVAPKTIPKTTSGKISRSRVRSEFESHALSVVFEWRSKSSEECLKEEAKGERAMASDMNALEIEDFKKAGGKAEAKEDSRQAEAKEDSRQAEAKEDSRQAEAKDGESMNLLSTISEKSQEEKDFEVTLPSQLDGVDTVGERGEHKA